VSLVRIQYRPPDFPREEGLFSTNFPLSTIKPD
jgi:hypothetical protein